tara:strand:- start:1236 stop:1490 length:255 start_codon:yes stop_codon:yes gene_type:complete
MIKFTYQVLKSFKQDYTDLENFQDAELVVEDTIELDCSGFANPLEVLWAWTIREARIYNKKLSDQEKKDFSYIVRQKDSLKGEE